jgi:hypothetical protein
MVDEDTQQFRDRGGRVLLIAPPSGVAQVLRLTGLDQLPNVDLVKNAPSRPT